MHQLELRAIFTTEVADTQNQLEADTLLLISFSWRQRFGEWAKSYSQNNYIDTQS